MKQPRPCDLRAPLRQLVGGRLRELRVDAELTQTQVGARTGIHRPIVGRIERGVHDVSLETLARFAGALGLDLGTVACVLDPQWVNGALEAERHVHASLSAHAPLKTLVTACADDAAATARAGRPPLAARAGRLSVRWRM